VPAIVVVGAMVEGTVVDGSTALAPCADTCWA
jgi:hypothetical protein